MSQPISTNETSTHSSPSHGFQGGHWHQNFLVHAPVAVCQYVLRPDGSHGFTHISAGGANIHEVDPEHFIQTQGLWWEMTHPEDIAALQRTSQLSAETLQLWQWEGRIITPSHQVKWIQGVAQPTCRDNGDIVWDGVLLDISNRKQTETSLIRSEAQNRLLVDIIPDLLLRVSRTGIYLEVRESALVKTVIPGAEMLGKSMLEVLPLDNAQIMMQHLDRAFETGETQIFEHHLIIDGEMQYEEVRIVVADDNVALLIIRDITETIVTQQQLELQHSITQALMGTTGSLEIVLPKLLRMICEQIDWQMGELWIPDTKEPILCRSASWHCPDETLTAFASHSQQYRLGKDTGFAGKVWVTSQFQWAEDVTQLGCFLSTSPAMKAGIHSAIGIPLMSGETVLGVLVLFSQTTRLFNAALRDIMIAIGGQIGQFIERKRTEHELQRQSRLAKLLAMTSLRIRGSLDIQAILNTTVAEVRQFLDTQRVVVYQFTPGWGGKVIVESVTSGWKSILHEEIYDTCFTGIYTHQYQEGRTRAIEDIYTEGITPCHIDLLARLQVRANLVVPILVNDKLWGLLIAHHCAGSRHWQPWEIDFLEKLAVQAGVGVQQANLYLQLSSELRERRQTEAQLLAVLQELEQQKSALDEAAMVTRLDANGYITYVNDKFSQFSQFSRDEVLGKTPRAIMGQEHSPEFFQDIKETITSGRVWHGEVQSRSKDSSFYWMDTTIVPFLENSGKPNAYLAICFDITERKVVQEQLRSIQKRLQYLLSSSPAVIYTCKSTLPCPITFISPNIRSLLGWAAYEFTRNLNFRAELIHPEDAKGVWATLATLLETQQLVLEYRMRHHDGGYRWIRDEVRVVNDDHTQIIECIGSMIDVTDRRIAESQVLQALERERELGELKSRFVCNTSHEFRTPLATIFAASDLLKRFGHKLSDEKKQERLDKIQTEVKHMTSLLEDVLLLGKVSVGQLPFEPVALDLDAFCRNLLEENELLIGQSHTLQFQSQGDCHEVMADERLLKQVVTNLLSNAVKYSPSGGVVLLTLIGDSQQITLQVEDHGIGIAKQDQSQLFEDFFRASNVGNLPGTGLGLAIVKQAVDMHGGTVSVSSEVGQGTTITIYLPRGGSSLEPNGQLADKQTTE